MTIEVDPFAPQADPYPMYALLREKAPVYRIEPHFWAVSRYEDVLLVLKNPQLFSSDTRLEQMRPPYVDDDLWDELAFLRARYIISTDPPEHTRLRKRIGGAFTPQAIAALEDRIRRLATDLFDAILAKKESDIVADLAVHLPIVVIAEMLGIDPAQRMDFKRWSEGLLEIGQIFRQTMMSREHAAELVRSRSELVAHLERLIADRRARPRGDLISEIARSGAEDETLTTEEAISMIIILLIAGNETTTNLIATGTHLLLDHPEALAALRDDPSRIPAFIEETLRFEGTAVMLFRRTTADVTLAGVSIPKDQLVLPLLASANRDPAAFPDPDRFDIRRDTRGHVAFGHGIHFCVGALLSRLEGRVVFEEMLRRMPSFSRVDAQPEWNLTTTLRALRSLRIRLDRPAARPIAAIA